MNFLKENIAFLLKQNQEIGVSQLALQTIDKDVLTFKRVPSPDELIALSSYFSIPVDDLLKMNLAQSRKKTDIQFLVLDVDGVMTDGGMYYTHNGDEFKKFSTRDGMGIKNITKAGFKIGIISSGFKAELIQRRAELLGIQLVHVGRGSKLTVLKNWCKELGISLKQVAFIGDDINDTEIMSVVGLAACPSNAVPKIKAVAHVILSRKGGDDCIREFIDIFLPDYNIWQPEE